jgi:uncharacterized protein DUF5916/cellulose/xylan binding protein with CBM9 domain
VTTGPAAAAIASACLALASTGARADDAAAAQAPVTAAATVRGKIPHVAKGEVKLDGVLDDEIWTHALVVELAFETFPGENRPAPVSTKAYLVEDGSRLLVAFDARDPDPKSIRAFLRDSDTAWNDDFVGIVIDTFNDERRAFEFFANPLGVQMDAIQDDVNRFENTAWNAIWDSAGKITADGYVVEIAIPFSQIRFPRSGREQVWGVDLLRYWPRNSRTRLANNAQDRNRSCYICQFGKYEGLTNAEPGRNLEVVPSLTTTRTDTRPATANGTFTNGSFDTELGVGVRWGITPDVTADLTINPDFSQVEADVAQLQENTEFALFYPETRPFFLEGSDYYDSPLQAVYTRTIADPDVGAKLTGRLGHNTFGTFVTRDAVTNLLIPGPLGSSTTSLAQPNDGIVARYTRGYGSASTIGALIALRNGDGYSNDVGGIDGRYRINDQNFIRFQYLTSRTEYPSEVATAFEQPTGRFEGDAYRVEYRYGARNWYSYYFHERLDPGFRADTGFISRVDLVRDNVETGHIWQGPGGVWWTELRAGAYLNDARDTQGRLLGRSVQPFFSFNGPLQSFMEVDVGPQQEFWNGQVFDTKSVFVYAQMRPLGGVSAYFQGRYGEQLDYANSLVRDEQRIQPQIEWNATRHLLVRGRYTLDRLWSQQGPIVYKARLTDLRLTWQFNVRSFVRLTLQGSDVERNLSQYVDPTTTPSSASRAAQLLYSYKLNPQTVFFAGYSSNQLEDETTGRIEPTGRTAFLKVSYAWTP